MQDKETMKRFLLNLAAPTQKSSFQIVTFAHGPPLIGSNQVSEKLKRAAEKL